ncbi:SMP-30/gluconolactonase/LRE family protein [Actinoplanes sp. CA-015351]|uniref:SMP-30/gluconolactonase/LRE family protein n=1 Tax=Actinoplanes sp. CA-015351 TaxID=3239897 RepID=UPI003D95D700
MRIPKVRAWVTFPAALLVLIVLAVAGFVLFRDPPVEPFEPVAWDPPAALTAPAVIAAGDIVPLTGTEVDGPEDLAVDEGGLVYTGDRQGRILRVDPATGRAEVFAQVGGRPLGLVFATDGGLIVANHGVGLQSVTPDGRVRLLTAAAGGSPIRFANDVTLAPDGTIYFSDASSQHHVGTLGAVPSYSLYDLIEGRPHGRLLRFDPSTGRTTELLTGLYFPNGVVATADGSAVLVAESTRYRITRYQLATGNADVLVDGLPGLADGFTRAADGTLLLALYDRVTALDRYVLPYRWARGLLVRLPQSMLLDEDRPQAGSILVLTDSGDVVRHLVGAAPAAANVVPYRDRWLIGSLTGDRIRVMSPPA